MTLKNVLWMLTAACCLSGVAGLFAQQAAPQAPVADPQGQPALEPPPGAPPIRLNNVQVYSPPSTSPAPGGKTANAYWSLAIQSDPADLKVYREKNKALGPPKEGEQRVVFLGDSITENWGRDLARYFHGKTNYIGRGYTSETTLHMLVRFRPDVINLQAKVVVLMAGVNDIAGNSGAVPDETIHDNFMSMFDLAKANNIKVVLVSTLPATHFFWQPGIDPQDRIVALNQWLKEYAGKNGIYFVDAHSQFKDEKNGMKPGMSSDTVHPNATGYTLLSQLVEGSIEKALKGEPPAAE